MKAEETLGAGDSQRFGVGMKREENAFARGEVRFVHRDKNGKVKSDRLIPNQMTLVGDAHIADQLSDQGEAAMSHMAYGTGSGGKTDASTTLEVETGRGAFSSGPTQGSGANDHQVTYVYTISGVTATLEEYGIFNSATANGGTMLCYTEATHALSSGDTLQITWTVSISH